MHGFRFAGVCAVLLAAPATAAGQGISIQGALGTHLNGGGNSQAVSVVFSAGERVDLLINGERSHLPTRVTPLERGVALSRGGTATFASGEIRFLLLGPDGVSPYVLGGAGRGVSRPNVNENFPDPVTSDATVFFAGGGVRVPLNGHLSLFGDVRFLILGEQDSATLLAPVRGGLAWRF